MTKSQKATTLVDEVKSLPVSAAVIGDQIPVWKNHFRLPKPGIVSAFAVVTLPSQTTLTATRYDIGSNA